VTVDADKKAARKRGGVAPPGARKAAAEKRAASRSRLLNIPGSCAYTGWPATTIRALVHKGHLPVVYLPFDTSHKHMWLRREDLDAAIEKWTEHRA
jgi:hypothetical protein